MTSGHVSRAGKGSVSLLLLPPPPSPPERGALRAAYREPLKSAIDWIPSSSTLLVAVTDEFLPVEWASLQSLLAGIYSLVATIQATSSSNEVDVSVILIDHTPDRAYPFDRITSPSDSTIVDLGTFASHPTRRWLNVFHSSTEAGYALLTEFLRIAEPSQTFLQRQLIALPGGLSLNNSSKSPSGQKRAAHSLHRSVILAGTFDHFHVGHKLLVQASALLLDLPAAKSPDFKPASYIVGISGDSLLKNKKHAEELETWLVRARSVMEFLSAVLCSPLKPEDIHEIGKDEEVWAAFCDGRLMVRLVNIADVYGPTIQIEDIEALIISAETRAGGAAVNKKRVEQGWHQLKIYEIDVLNALGEVRDDKGGEAPTAEDFSAKISSTAIRQKLAEKREQPS